MGGWIAWWVSLLSYVLLYCGVPSIVRVCAKRFHPHYSGHPHYMISGLNSAPSRTIHDITRIKHCMGYVQPTRRMTGWHTVVYATRGQNEMWRF